MTKQSSQVKPKKTIRAQHPSPVTKSQNKSGRRRRSWLHSGFWLFLKKRGRTAPEALILGRCNEEACLSQKITRLITGVISGHLRRMSWFVRQLMLTMQKQAMIWIWRSG
jgi:hypothetical protein